MRFTLVALACLAPYFLASESASAKGENCSWWWEVNETTADHHGQGPLGTYRPEIFSGAHKRSGKISSGRARSRLGPDCVIAYSSWSFLNTKDGRESFPDQGPLMKCEAGPVPGWQSTYYTRLECVRDVQFARITRAIESNLCGIEHDDMDGCQHNPELKDPDCKKTAQLWTEACELSRAGGMLCIVKNALEVIQNLDKSLIDAVIVEVDDKLGNFRELLPAYEKAVGAKKMYVAYYGNNKEEVCKYSSRGMHIIIKKKGRELDGTNMDCCP